MRSSARFTFPEEPSSPSAAYVAPEDRVNRVVTFKEKGTHSTNRNTFSHIYSLGVALLEAVTLEQCKFSGISTGQKKQFLDASNLLTLEVKKLILNMSEEDPGKRATLSEVLMELKRYKDETTAKSLD